MSSYPDIHTHRFRAMGSEIAIWLQHANSAEAGRLLLQGQALFDEAEDWMSRFRPKSELMRMNAQAGGWVSISGDLWRVIERAVQAAEATDGLFDPTQLGALQAAGYASSFDPSWRDGILLPDAGPGQIQAEACGLWCSVELRKFPPSVRFPSGLGIDLGGIGKGIVAQEVVEYLSAHGPCLVDAGGDLTAGAAPAGEPGWPVAIASPAGDTVARPALNLWLRRATLATSGTDYRWWRIEGQRRHHLIDPRTGRPAESDLLTATVLAMDAADAEAWATALLIAGAREGLRLAEERGLAAVLFLSAERTAVSSAMSGMLVM